MYDVLSDNGVSKVVRNGDWVYKYQPKFLTDNEWYALRLLKDAGLVPEAEKVDIESVKTRYIRSEPVTDPELFRYNCMAALNTLRDYKIRHGDLTRYAILVVGNAPVIIDWAESRHWDDPRPDKRREGDNYWMNRTIEELCDEYTCVRAVEYYPAARRFYR